MNISIVLGLLLIAGNVFADSGNVSWTEATQREDGTPLAITEIASHNVYYTDGTPGNYVNQINIPAPAKTATIPLTSYPFDVVVTTVDTDGRESAYSTVVSVPAGKATPGAPTGITITIQYGNVTQ